MKTYIYSLGFDMTDLEIIAESQEEADAQLDEEVWKEFGSVTYWVAGVDVEEDEDEV